SGRVRLGHRETGAHRAFKARLQPFLLLFRGAELGEYFHVAGIGRHAVEDARADWAASHHFTQRRVFVIVQTRAVLGIWQEKIPQTFGLGLSTKPRDDRRLVVRIWRQLLVGDFFGLVNVLVHEGVNASAE